MILYCSSHQAYYLWRRIHFILNVKYNLVYGYFSVLLLWPMSLDCCYPSFRIDFMNQGRCIGLARSANFCISVSIYDNKVSDEAFTCCIERGLLKNWHRCPVQRFVLQQLNWPYSALHRQPWAPADSVSYEFPCILHQIFFYKMTSVHACECPTNMDVESTMFFILQWPGKMGFWYDYWYSILLINPECSILLQRPSWKQVDWPNSHANWKLI